LLIGFVVECAFLSSSREKSVGMEWKGFINDPLEG